LVGYKGASHYCRHSKWAWITWY